MSECLWCDAPTLGNDKLCPECLAVNNGPVFHCDKPRHTIPSLGTSCVECDREREHAERVRARNAPHLAQLAEIRAQHIRDFNKPWPGLEFGKAHFGQMLDAAIRKLGGTP
jgi:hypothetical protein